MSDRALALKTFDVSRETIDRLDIYERLLRDWTSVTNLIGPAELNSLWLRHFADSLQLKSMAPPGQVWVDMGTGAGFPGLVIAIDSVLDRDAHFHLIEPDGRKCAFLREVIRSTQVQATVYRARAEDVVGELGRVDVITSRAMAPLKDLVALSEDLILNGAIGLFPKGKGYKSEVATLSPSDHLAIDITPSLTSSESVVVKVRRASRSPQ